MEKTPFKTKLKRVLKAGFFNFWRSSYVSFASIIVMIITLSVIGSVIFLSTILNITMEELRDKVDVNVYFVNTALEEDIISLKTKIEALPEVKLVQYTNREEALENFRLQHENDQITLQALDELGENPLGAALNIKAKEPSQYEGIANFLNEENILSSEGEKIIDKINYFENKEAIDRLSKIIDSAERLSWVISLTLVTISIIMTFNTTRLAIYISREEISVMQLVGASKNYVRGPFVVTGVIVGLFSGLLTIFIFLPICYWLGNTTQDFFIGLNIFDYYLDNFFQILLIIISAGIAIGALSSYLAVRRYLKL
ncbi:MAG: ABC transporter permease [Candidatus Zambryskibacteria bacterium]|nr:ABC transporter permease [Candidatus Zambryskibacteria bacterium]